MKQYEAGIKQKLGSSLIYSSSLQMEVACSFETSVDFQQTTRRYIPEDARLRKSNLFNPMEYIPF
jgi:hypothetical protein